MGGHITRRGTLIGSMLTLPALSLVMRSTAAAPMEQSGITAAFKAMEEKTGARLGVSALDTGSGKRIGYRDNERFAMCSTFKFLASAAILARVDSGQEQLDRKILVKKKDILPHSPVTGKHVGATMTIAQLCEATVTISDNAAGNLVLEALGGPKGLTKYARSLGDGTFRLDRWETELNEAKPGDPRDTITPAGMLADMQKTVLGDALSVSSREQLKQWLVANQTGDKRIRAGVPKNWTVGDKTGTGETGMANDIAVLWPSDRHPILLAIYLYDPKGTPAGRDATHEQVASLVVDNL
ncbi:class A beta-lactamase [Phyllobacterium sp. SB3]|uniref:class A beta-lactamase n=1 Tax=Phyllobacterium sp. SB3 TaxID=3156073 RepID=UPI0032B0164B